MSLRLAPQHLDALREHAARSYPEECCGVLAGALGQGDERDVREVLALANEKARERHRRYLIPPEAYLKADLDCRGRGLQILGFYHSHPDHPARPSDFDRDHAWPWYSYVIIEVARGEPRDIRSWTLRDDRSAFEAEEIGVAPQGGARAPALAPTQERSHDCAGGAPLTEGRPCPSRS